ncbi:MAG: exonuclease SbcCD subunit D [Thermoleophilia bacterium]|nr:exonuclease SbcCD subunit D [Thermoleophilia bacterium]
MKLLHTGDWHLGKRLFGVERMDEAEAALAQVAEVAERERVDAVVVAGDLLDRRIVDPAAFGACLRAMERLARVAPVLAVAGNHDDPDLWIHLAPHLAASGIHVAGRVRPAAEAVQTLQTPSGPLHAALLPWPEPSRMALDAGASVQDARIRYADRVASVVRSYADELVRRRREEGGAALLVGHLMVDRAKAGGGERELTMGITYAISSASLPADLDYIALGHVHRPQTIPGLSAPGRYAGSPLALDFSDEGIEPSAVVVEIAGDRTTTRLEPLTAARPLVSLRGPLERMGEMAAAHPEAWFACAVELEAPVMDLVRRVRDDVPGALRVEPVYAAADDEQAPGADAASEGGEAIADLYGDWHRREGRAMTPAQAAAFAEALAAAEPGAEAG